MAFVQSSGSEQGQTAALLLALAREKKIDTSLIRIVQDGFEVPDELLSETDKKVVEKKADEPEKAPEAPQDDEKPEAKEEAPKAAEEPHKPAPRRRGRPPGSHNKPKAVEKPAEDTKAEGE